MNNKVLNGGGYDVLKYMMALLIVAIHARAFYGEYTSIFFKPLTEIAVPVFFILSSFFYFRKLYYCENIWSNLFTYLKRIGLLYLFWFCVNIPVILHYKHYFIQNGIIDVFRLISDVILRTTYSGSWFLSATALAVVIYTIMFRSKVIKWFLFALSVIVLFYINCIDVIPENLHGFYDWWTTNIRKDANLTVLEALAWVGIGCLFANPKLNSIHINKIFISVISCLFIGVLLYTTYHSLLILKQATKIVLAISLFFWAKSLDLAQTKRLKHLRQLSILYFMIHFLIIRVLGHTGIYNALGGILYYVVVLLITHLCSEMLIFMSSKRHFEWLKYAY